MTSNVPISIEMIIIVNILIALPLQRPDPTRTRWFHWIEVRRPWNFYILEKMFMSLGWNWCGHNKCAVTAANRVLGTVNVPSNIAMWRIWCNNKKERIFGLHCLI